MQQSKYLIRTGHPYNICFYKEDGFGRDRYIAYNNAGFWKDKMMQASNKPSPPKSSALIFRNNNNGKSPLIKYFGDGSGRDSYVIRNSGGLTKETQGLYTYGLQSFLRKNDNEGSPSKFKIVNKKIFLDKTERSSLNVIKNIESGVIKRLYSNKKYKLPQLKKELIGDMNFYTPLSKCNSTKCMNRTTVGFNSTRNKSSLNYNDHSNAGKCCFSNKNISNLNVTNGNSFRMGNIVLNTNNNTNGNAYHRNNSFNKCIYRKIKVCSENCSPRKVKNICIGHKINNSELF